MVDKEEVGKRAGADEGAVPRLDAINVVGTVCNEEEKAGVESMTASVGSTSGANRGCDKGHKIPLSPPLLSCRCISNALKHANESSSFINASMSCHRCWCVVVVVSVKFTYSFLSTPPSSPTSILVSSSSSLSSPRTKVFRPRLTKLFNAFKSFINAMFSGVNRAKEAPSNKERGFLRWTFWPASSCSKN